VLILPLVFDGKKLYVKINNQKYEPCVFSVNKKGSISSKPVNWPCFALHWWTYVFYSKEGTIQKNVVPNKHIKIPQNTVLFSFFKYMYTQFFVSNNLSNTGLAIIYFSKLFLFFILLVPLVVLAIILMIRVVILWVVIPFSPLIFSAYILWTMPSDYKNKVTDIISLIFQPAYVMFMLAIGFVLIEAVYQMEPAKNREKFYKTFNVEEIKWKNEMRVWDVAMIQRDVGNWKFANWTSWSSFFDYFSWFLVNLLAGFVLWSLVFTALKSNKFTEKVASTIDTYVKKTAETLPILPGKQSLASLQQTWSTISRNLPSQAIGSQFTNLEEIVKNNKKDDKDKTTKW